MKKYYSIEGTKVIDRLEGRTEAAIKTQATKLRLIYRRYNKFKYVYQKRDKYTVRFRINGKYKSFGTFDSEEEAAKVAMEKAKEYGKKFDSQY